MSKKEIKEIIMLSIKLKNKNVNKFFEIKGRILEKTCK